MTSWSFVFESEQEGVVIGVGPRELPEGPSNSGDCAFDEDPELECATGNVKVADTSEGLYACAEMEGRVSSGMISTKAGYG